MGKTKKRGGKNEKADQERQQNTQKRPKNDENLKKVVCSIRDAIQVFLFHPYLNFTLPSSEFHLFQIPPWSVFHPNPKDESLENRLKVIHNFQ